MRLLTTKEPYAFIESDSYLPYAILSHTWVHTEAGEGAEVTYKDLFAYIKDDDKREAIAARPEFDKIRQATRAAARDGHKYIWLDTCCIDKNNNQELDEAIRCMFKWYRDATICYAYLSDVAPVNEPAVEIGLGFETSRWFTRGWTLQELVAPKDVVFLAKDWTFLGYRMGELHFQRALSEASAIDENVLFGGAMPSDFSISTRMRWASRRMTTRIEDKAYSLMGIFGVHMPIMYGEGKAAFIRLQEEILKNSDDHSIFAWTSPHANPYKLYGLLADSPSRFKSSTTVRQFLPSNDSDHTGGEWQVTNIGLRLKLLMLPINAGRATGDYSARLECYVFSGKAPISPVIRLRRLWGDQFARVHAHELTWQNNEVKLLGLKHMLLYVKQHPAFRLPQITISPTNLASHLSGAANGYELIDVFPLVFWDGRSFFRGTSGDLRYPMGLFRFASTRYRSHRTFRVDVAVGFRSEGPGKWKVWHIQRRCYGESMHDAYDDIFDHIQHVQTFPERLERPGQIRGLSQLYGDRDAWTVGEFIDSRVITTVTQPNSETVASLLSFMIELHHIPEIDSEPVAEIQMKPSTQSMHRPPETLAFDLCNTEFQDLALKLTAGTIPWEFKLNSTTDRLDFMRSVRVGPLDYLQLKKVISDTATERLFDGSDGSDLSDLEKYMRVCIEGDVDRLNAMLRPRKTRKYLLGSKQNDIGFTGLHWAAAYGHAKLVQRLIHFGTSTKAAMNGGWTACQLAVALGHESVVDILTKHEAKITFRWKKADVEAGESIYHIVATIPYLYSHNILGRAFWPQPVRTELTRGRRFGRRKNHVPYMMNMRGETPLHRAAAAGNIDVVEILLGITTSTIDFVDAYDRTPLWHAAAGGHWETALLLIEQDAYIDAQDSNGLSPLHIACWNWHAGVVRTLLTHNAVPDIGTPVHEFTPAHFAYYGQSSECVRLLELRGVNMEARSIPHWCSVTPAGMEDLVGAVFDFAQRPESSEQYKMNFHSRRVENARISSSD
ncbi:het and ankyrin domain protein [Ophiostoma piceae UAMH 11346]|uniref:Het and ankyrin domain protein n=1 Tax=Ophiostoma piceae (strain UAMH 11346) TaxID=1262450 RepID=S3BVJ2_OPHP1|nr:het and ankyrin domain protein [Ophiostoma piceae UAMH 11346]